MRADEQQLPRLRRVVVFKVAGRIILALEQSTRSWGAPGGGVRRWSRCLSC